MTNDEAKKVAEIVAMADGGCSTCARSLMRHVVKAFPDVDWATAAKDIESYPGNAMRDEIAELKAASR